MARDCDFEVIVPNEWLLHQVPFTNGELIFGPVNAPDDIARFLKTPAGSALFSIERTTWLEDKSVTYAQLYFARDHKMNTSIVASKATPRRASNTITNKRWWP